MKKKKNKDSNGQERETKVDDNKTIIIKNILNDVYQILTLFKPILSKMMEMEEAPILEKNGTFGEAARLFGNIAKNSRDLEVQSAQEFLNLTN